MIISLTGVMVTASPEACPIGNLCLCAISQR